MRAVQTVRHLIVALAVFAAAGLSAGGSAGAQERPIKIVALGDSLTAGFGLSASEAFPARLGAALKAKGLEVDIVNAGVSGDTSTGGLERLDWAVPDGTDAVIVELGANDALRGIDPAVTRKAIDTIVRKLRERRIAVLLCGMLAPPNMGADYAEATRKLYADTAQTHGALFYPFFLDGVAAVADLNQPDGIHPTAAGVDVIVSRILPSVEQLIEQARTRRGS